jgi:hypothetical protein
MAKIDEYSGYATHPRYGQRPRITGLNPKNDYGGEVFLHWHSADECRIPNTAIPADLSRQTPATVPVTHYFDAKRQCHDCGRPFIFFAEEQKYWYEELGFGLDSDCVRCVPCRKKQQGIARSRERYEALSHTQDKTIDQNLEMAECCLGLVEASVFHKNQIQHIRMLLKQLPSGLGQDAQKKLSELHVRLLALETQNNADSAASVGRRR